MRTPSNNRFFAAVQLLGIGALLALLVVGDALLSIALMPVEIARSLSAPAA